MRVSETNPAMVWSHSCLHVTGQLQRLRPLLSECGTHMHACEKCLEARLSATMVQSSSIIVHPLSPSLYVCAVSVFLCLFIICLSPQSRNIHQPMSVYNTVVLWKSCHNLSLRRLLKATIFTNSFYSYQGPPRNHGSHKDMATSESLNGQGWLQEGWGSREVGKSLRGRHMNH